ncbi:unnamed protein product [Protopolystoma xenopodis]|uniref:Uncharacterized protein n=1 Tax=Protopolystoma xenopodis TaxID=117903 RepID=A0A3S5FC43_9PLAT|nr:unnamed protein product [Protopolystoma xenopodis]
MDSGQVSDGPSTQPNDELPGNQANGLAASGTKGSNQSVYLSLWDERKAAGDKSKLNLVSTSADPYC